MVRTEGNTVQNYVIFWVDIKKRGKLLSYSTVDILLVQIQTRFVCGNTAYRNELPGHLG
jgi:hypothetical protein